MRRLAMYDTKTERFTIGTVIDTTADGLSLIVRVQPNDDAGSADLRELFLTAMGVPLHIIFPERMILVGSECTPQQDGLGQSSIDYTCVFQRDKPIYYQYLEMTHLDAPSKIFVNGALMDFEFKSGIVIMARPVTYDYEDIARIKLVWQ